MDNNTNNLQTRFSNMTDDELYKIIHVEYQNYASDAIILANEEFERRGLEKEKHVLVKEENTDEAKKQIKRYNFRNIGWISIFTPLIYVLVGAAIARFTFIFILNRFKDLLNQEYNINDINKYFKAFASIVVIAFLLKVLFGKLIDENIMIALAVLKGAIYAIIGIRLWRYLEKLANIPFIRLLFGSFVATGTIIIFANLCVVVFEFYPNIFENLPAWCLNLTTYANIAMELLLFIVLGMTLVRYPQSDKQEESAS